VSSNPPGFRQVGGRERVWRYARFSRSSPFQGVHAGGGRRRRETDPLRPFGRAPWIGQILYSGWRGCPPATRVNRRRQHRRPCPRPVHLSADSGGGTDRRRTVSVGRCLPTRSDDPRSERDKPGAPSLAVDRAVAGGCAADLCCRSAGTARLPRSRPAGGHRLADSADLDSPWRTSLLTTHRLPTISGQLQSPNGRHTADQHRERWRQPRARRLDCCGVAP
jgi:hypothetical protein